MAFYRHSAKVTVCVVTYNQENCIGQCLQSLVDQETNFAFEVIVSDDASTDGTPKIIAEFASNYPRIIKPIYRRKNIGAYENFRITHAIPKSIYVAHMDGDDYALPGKLQAQVDFLDSNPDYSMCFHRMRILTPEGFVESKYGENKLDCFKFRRSDLIKYIAIGANSSKMYRSSCRISDYPKFDMVDYTVNVLDIGDGCAGYCCNKALGVYRAGAGISGSQSVYDSVLNSLREFSFRFSEHAEEINISSWAWCISSFKCRNPIWREFFVHAMKTGGLKGLFKYIMEIKFRRILSGL